MILKFLCKELILNVLKFYICMYKFEEIGDQIFFFNKYNYEKDNFKYICIFRFEVFWKYMF